MENNKITCYTWGAIPVESNNLNLQRSRYSRLKWDIDKLKYEKWSKYRFKQPKPTARTNFYVQEYRAITRNTKLGKIKT